MKQLTFILRYLLALILIVLVLSSAHAGQMLSQGTFKRLEVIHNLIGEEKYKEALAKLEELKGRIRNNNLEKATLWQSYGYAYASMNQYKKAIDAFNKCLSFNALAELAQNNMQFNVAQLYLATDDFKNAQTSIEKWLAKQKKVSIAGHELAGTIYAQNKQHVKTVQHLSAAIKQSAKPKEAWFQILLATYYEQKDYKSSANTLERMVQFFPHKKDYWKQLSGVYYTLKNDKKALAALEMAYQKKLLTEEAELINLSKLYMLLNIPFKAAKLIETAIQNQQVAGSPKNLEMLSEYHLQAKDYNKAVAVLQKAAELTGDAELYYRIAQLQIEEGQWKGAVASLSSALKLSTLKKKDEAYLLKGVAHYELKEWNNAKNAFTAAMQHNKNNDQAEQWLQIISQIEVK